MHLTYEKVPKSEAQYSIHSNEKYDSAEWRIFGVLFGRIVLIHIVTPISLSKPIGTTYKLKISALNELGAKIIR